MPVRWLPLCCGGLRRWCSSTWLPISCSARSITTVRLRTSSRRFAQTAVATFLLGWLFGRAEGQSKWPQVVVLALVALDLGIANGWMVPTADAKQWKQPTELAEIVSRAPRTNGDAAAARVYRQPGWLPEEWKESGSSDRLEQVLDWDRATGSPKHNLSAHFAIAEVYGTMLPHDYQVFLWYIKYRGGGTIPLAPDLAASGVGYAVLSSDESFNVTVPEEAQTGAGQGTLESKPISKGTSLWTTPDPMPRAWFVPHVEVLAPLDTDNWRTVWQRTAEVFHPEGTQRDLRQVAVVEATEEELAAAGVERSAAIDPDRAEARCRIVSYDPTFVELQVKTTQPGLVVLADQFFPGLGGGGRDRRAGEASGDDSADESGDAWGLGWAKGSTVWCFGIGRWGLCMVGL